MLGRILSGTPDEKRSPEIVITLELQSFRQGHPRGNVTGVIFLELESGAFPGRSWSDFPVIVLSWWTGAHLQLAESGVREVEWRFMDGPYGITITKEKDRLASASCDYESFKRSLLDATERVIAHCDTHNMSSPDLEILRGNAERLRANQSADRMPLSAPRKFGRQ